MKQFSYILIFMFAVISLASCGIKTRAYLADKERVDQKIPESTGFSGKAEEASKKTRKVFVLEFVEQPKVSKAVIEVDETQEFKVVDGAGQSKVVIDKKDTVVVHEDNFSFQDQTKETLTYKKNTQIPSEYVVDKDDTLQKVSKKFYDSYSKWPKIYEANKDAIKDPNFLKPGTVLQIPTLED